MHLDTAAMNGLIPAGAQSPRATSDRAGTLAGGVLGQAHDGDRVAKLPSGRFFQLLGNHYAGILQPLCSYQAIIRQLATR